ncbi:MAG TPA: 3-methyl-2-oxobutanoate hydroxymethyltransferase [Peptococcaceae bacterium]|jgi:3-methyl-2-oxobutanoate hydroxymethyltransferase|nr:3-methyl-2-oxobutanoate hydroxymethyltransferase [Clostridia bacterium]HOB81649.1 3-methyl-2-oxobutanoate hydroxymethyltransferase [Peptococcaceae bacterium]HPZ71721.1 3-methyl-2-oxobutanoate hydroxymethyltransferase [Peptococcaceae bacterium]HQD54618.1 3-methyl-2-oxobutanoate hydroxymethyltransferase [Peptococcaceae bacterium]
MAEKITVSVLREKKAQGLKITMVTAYDYPSARMVEEAGLDMILVGDSLGNAVLGYENTLPVTMDEMVHHTRAVCRGTRHTFVVADLPFLSYHVSVEQAILNAGRLVKEGGAQAVKLEGGKERLEVIKRIIAAEIPVMGHLGLTPQSIHQFGGFKVQGKNKEQAEKLLADALLLEEAGVFALVLECVPAPLAAMITEKLSIPTIGIGAGAGCDGQVLVWHDLLGITQDLKPRFVKNYAHLHDDITGALKQYKAEVEKGQFPAAEHSYTMKEEEIPRLY